MRIGVLLLLLVALPLFAAEPKVDDVAWMAGHWASTSDGAYSEELWLEPRANLMMGMNRGVSKSGRVSFEFLRVQATKDGVFYMAQPGGKPATPFKLVEVSPNKAVFSNPEHDFPQRIIYTLRDNRLCGRVEGTMDGKEAAEEFCWDRVTLATAAPPPPAPTSRRH